MASQTPTGGPPDGGPESKPATPIATPSRRTPKHVRLSEQWLEEPVDTAGSVWKSDIAILDKTRNLTFAANRSAAERIANRAVLDAIVRARRNEHPEDDIAGLIQIAQNAALEASTPEKHDQRGKHRITGPDMTVDELLEQIPIFRWPRAGGNGCHNVHCNHNNILHKNHPQKDHRMIDSQKMVDGDAR
jgi:hypothetical protein